jgi:hypothetical protein
MRLFIWGLAVSASLLLTGCSNSGPNIDKQADADIGDTTTGTGGMGSGPSGTGGSAPADNPAAGVSNP